MLQVDYTSIFVFVIVLFVSFFIILNLELDESVNDKWTKFGISFVIAACLSAGIYIYNTAVSDELMTGNFAFDDVRLPEPEYLVSA
jgi:hypothetical protein